MPLTRSEGAFEWSGMFRLPERLFTPSGELPIRIEEYLDDGVLVIRAELPGLTPEDIDVSVHGHVLRIRAERLETGRDRPKGEYRSEFRYGTFARSLTLPIEASTDDVSATYGDGIVELRLPLDGRRARSTATIPVVWRT